MHISQCLAGGLWAVAVWDSTWNAYNNCYALVREGRTILIDCGKSEHAGILADGLRELGINPSGIDALVATHGHRDHTGAAGSFAPAKGAIHPADHDLLQPEIRERFAAPLPDRGDFLGLACERLGFHTLGSVALFDPVTKALFCGDHPAFSDRPLPEKGRLVTGGDALREAYVEETRVWHESLSPGERMKYRGYWQGLATMASCDAEWLCTGHGLVLRGDIYAFLKSLAMVGLPAGLAN